MAITHYDGLELAQASRTRSLLRDACGCLSQQMVYWGCDARYPQGSLLKRFGMERIEVSGPARREGSSRYRIPWMNGVVELHSFCAGWYGFDASGVVYIRHRARMFSCSGGWSGHSGLDWEHHAESLPSDAMLKHCRPLLQWVYAYETWVRSECRASYRRNCRRLVASIPASRPWLPAPDDLNWIEQFLSDPRTTPRSRDILRQELRGSRQLPQRDARKPDDSRLH